jgi:hypothetical protein
MQPDRSTSSSQLLADDDQDLILFGDPAWKNKPNLLLNQQIDQLNDYFERTHDQDPFSICDNLGHTDDIQIHDGGVGLLGHADALEDFTITASPAQQQQFDTSTQYREMTHQPQDALYQKEHHDRQSHGRAFEIPPHENSTNNNTVNNPLGMVGQGSNVASAPPPPDFWQTLLPSSPEILQLARKKLETEEGGLDERPGIGYRSPPVLHSFTFASILDSTFDCAL